MAYDIIIHEETLLQIEKYQHDLINSRKQSGRYLNEILASQNIQNMGCEAFIEALLQTKKPQIFAEMAVKGNGTDWNQDELKILGNIGISCQVTVFDDAKHRLPIIHKEPFQAHLLFTPGALLRNGYHEIPVDFDVVNQHERSINFDAYYHLYEQRLLPLLLHANEVAEEATEKAVVTIPGIGCGQFAGVFIGQMGAHFEKVLQKLLDDHSERLASIQAVYYDPYNECEPSRNKTIDGITFIVNPLMYGNGHSQLAKPEKFDATLKDCLLFSVVAWDHVSWPGNDYWAGSRMTDDGVKAAATDTMKHFTGIEGHYDNVEYGYVPPEPYQSWQEVVQDKKLQLHCTKENLHVYQDQEANKMKLEMRF